MAKKTEKHEDANRKIIELKMLVPIRPTFLAINTANNSVAPLAFKPQPIKNPSFKGSLQNLFPSILPNSFPAIASMVSTIPNPIFLNNKSRLIERPIQINIKGWKTPKLNTSNASTM